MNLSADHPLRTNPNQPWPYKVLLGLRLSGKRQIVEHRSVYVRATSLRNAERAALRYARDMPARYKDGKRLIVSRPVTSRPLDKQDGGLVA